MNLKLTFIGIFLCVVGALAGGYCVLHVIPELRKAWTMNNSFLGPLDNMMSKFWYGAITLTTGVGAAVLAIVDYSRHKKMISFFVFLLGCTILLTGFWILLPKY